MSKLTDERIKEIASDLWCEDGAIASYDILKFALAIEREVLAAQEAPRAELTFDDWLFGMYGTLIKDPYILAMMEVSYNAGRSGGKSHG